MDAGQLRRESADADVDALAVVDPVGEPGGEPPDRVGADGEERHVAEVEQSREADDDVEPQRHHDVGERGHGVVHERTGLAEEEGQDDREAKERHGDDEIAVAVDRAQPHPASRVCSPSRPWGLTTMISTR